jgi:hypothetical protein
VHRRERVLWLTLLSTCFACGGDPEPLGWELVMEDPVLTDRIANVIATIRRGDCGGELVYSTDVSRAGAVPESPPVLEDGPWAFSGRATDGTCRLIAEGCVVTQLPTPGPVRIVLETIAVPTPLCEESFCSEGRCLATGRDGGADDAGPLDAGADAGSGEPCGTGRCTECEACEAETCVARSDGFVCADGLGRCVASECCTGCVDLGGACRPLGMCEPDGGSADSGATDSGM